jgi:hypothetical protein
LTQTHSDIEIHAPPAQVWHALVDFEQYVEWNPFIRQAMGQAREGAPFEMDLTAPGLGPARSKPRLVGFEDGRELHWRHRFLMPGLFDIDHTMTVKDIDEGRALFEQEGRFSGLLVPLCRGWIGGMQEGFDRMNEALKERSEALAQH